MKFRVLSLAALLFSSSLPAETVFLKDGKANQAKELRRDAGFLFYKATAPDGAQTETITPLNQVERIEFGDLPSLEEARAQAKQGDATGVLEKTAQPATVARNYSDIPGNQWAEVMRLRLPALAVAGTDQHITNLQAQWTPTGDQELDTACKLILAAKNDPNGARTAWKALAQPGASSLSAGISWLGIGNDALRAKQWNTAIRAFLSVEVFVTQQKLLQPTALLGAAKAFVQKGEIGKATSLVEEIKKDYPSAADAAASILK